MPNSRKMRLPPSAKTVSVTAQVHAPRHEAAHVGRVPLGHGEERRHGGEGIDDEQHRR
jgi:hypothetical protein